MKLFNGKFCGNSLYSCTELEAKISGKENKKNKYPILQPVQVKLIRNYKLNTAVKHFMNCCNSSESIMAAFKQSLCV